MKKYIPYVLFAIIFFLLFDISEVRRNNDIQLYNRVKRIEYITKLLPLGEQWLNPSDKSFVLHLSNVGFYF
ncbi:hypothetical protein, partial [uncultured Desulfovibrio sp.]|uniref:hypothetical protein n=1 Tax=uncultured Desulfovibrio sp. TaxID=167968 RepID=UPI002803C315